MTPEEKEKSLKLRRLVQQYEDEENRARQIELFESINQICEVSESDLNQYWEAYSLEDFCDSLAINIISGIEFSLENSIPIIKEMCSLLPQNTERFIYLYQKYGNAIEYVFQSSQYLWSAIYEEEKKFDEVMRDLNSSEGGPILL